MKKTVSLLLALVLAASLLPGAVLAAGSCTAAMPMDQKHLRRRGHGAASRPRLGGQHGVRRGVLVLSYDAARLAFTGCSDASYAVNDAVGTVTLRALRRFCVSRRGDAHVPAYRAGDTTVRLTAANIDAKGNANVQDAPRGAHSRRGNGAARRRELHRHAAGRWLYGAQDRPLQAGTTPLPLTRRTTITPISPLRSAARR